MVVWNAGQHEWLKLLAKKKKKKILNFIIYYLVTRLIRGIFQPFIFRIFCHFKNLSGYFMTLWHFLYICNLFPPVKYWNTENAIIGNRPLFYLPL